MNKEEPGKSLSKRVFWLIFIGSFITQTKITMDNKFQNFFCICDEYIINLFASMRLEKGH
jgi:hypothetical protein